MGQLRKNCLRGRRTGRLCPLCAAVVCAAVCRLSDQPGQRRRGLVMTANILSEFQGGGLGRMLVQGVAKDLTRRGVKAIEAFGDLRGDGISCVLPADYLLAVGFKTVRPHHHFPRLRLELKTTVSWREDVEVALERLLGSMTPERALRLA